MYASQAAQFFSSFLWPETTFRHEQKKQRADALLCSINNLQNTTFAVNRVEHKKTTNFWKKGKDYLVFGSNQSN